MSQPLGAAGDNPFDLPPDEMRELGYRVVDAIVDFQCGVSERPVMDWTEPGDTSGLSSEFPAEATNPLATIEAALEQVFGNTMRLTHPRFFSYIPGPGNYISTLADFLTSGFNVFAGTTPHNLGAFDVERATIDWLGTQFGWNFPNSGLFVSGGSAASLTALAAARHVQLGNDMANAVVYYSAQTHSSIERALFLLGFREDQLRQIEPDADYRLDPAALRLAIDADRAAGRKPFCLVANAGTTNTGAIDPLDSLADVCEREGLWFHVDAAYGGGAVLSKQARPLFAGIERAHTIAVDPHKWFFQPFECACVLGRDSDWFRDTFRRVPAYMRDSDSGGDQYNFRDMGIQVTRSFKAFKLWLSLKVYGVETFRAAVDRGLALARHAEHYVRSHGEWELVTPATLGVINCRYWVSGSSEKELDALNAHISEQLNRSGFAYVITTELQGRKVLRFCPIHPGATAADIDATFARLETFAKL